MSITVVVYVCEYIAVAVGICEYVAQNLVFIHVPLDGICMIILCIVKAINHVHEKGKNALEKKKKGEEVPEEAPAEEPEPEPAPAPETSEQILAEIRDLLKAQNPAPDVKDGEDKK